MKTVVLFLVLTISSVRILDAQDVSELFKTVRSGVVVISTEETEISLATGLQPVSAKGLGSGFYIGDGKIVTAAHVVQTANLVLVTFYNGHESFATVTASAMQADVALLELEEEPVGVSPLRLVSSASVEVGDEVFVVGAPFGLSYTLTVGHISSRYRNETHANVFTEVEFFQTDAAINQGNSGGPMFNMQGEVIGVVSSILTQSGGFEGIGFATTSSVARDVLINNKSFWWGVDGMFVTPAMRIFLNVPQSGGFLVQKVAGDSPAHKLGLRPSILPVNVLGQEIMIGGDIVLKIQGLAIDGAESIRQIQELVSNLNSGDRLTLQVLRAGRIIPLRLDIE